MARAETYRITDLGTLGTHSSFATGLNAAGQVSGYSATGTNTARAWRYSPGVGLVDLGSFGGADNRAMGINDAGLVTGYSTDSNGVTHGFISGGAGLTNIGGSGATSNILPQHINNAGRVAGFFLNAGDERPFLFSLPPFVPLFHLTLFRFSRPPFLPLFLLLPLLPSPKDPVRTLHSYFLKKIRRDKNC